MYSLAIAEKPELAKAIVDALGGASNTATARQDGYYDCGKIRVTYCFGHMLALLDPEDYDDKYKKWSLDHLPIVHIPWRKKPIEKSETQLNKILGLLPGSSEVLHAGDPDEEGQLLVDEILQLADYNKPVKRLLINDNSPVLVKRALENMRDNADFAGMSAAAEARSVGDQLYGYNLTRLYTLHARQKGFDGVLSVGRVQTVVLGMVVRRCRENGQHKKAFFYQVDGQFTLGALSFAARYQAAETDPKDDSGRLNDKDHAEALAKACTGVAATVRSVETKIKTESPPLPYNLLKLQTDASRKYGMKPSHVLEVTQTLREKHKLITYNRSDTQYLNPEHHALATGVLAAIGKTAPLLQKACAAADPSIMSKAFDAAKVTIHHGIIPQETVADFAALSTDEAKIYLLIARSYIAQFFPKHEYEATEVDLVVEGNTFKCRSRVPAIQGWRDLYRNDTDNEELETDKDDLSISLNSLKKNETGMCIDAQAEQKETKPRPLFTMATLLTGLTRVAPDIKDPELRRAMVEKDKAKSGEHGGIGTPATRHSIIEGLFERNFMIEKGSSVISTPTADQFYDALPDRAKYPDMTAIWHEQQKEIAAGKGEVMAFVDNLMAYIGDEIERVNREGLPTLNIKVHPCPQCKKALRRKKGPKGPFWGCTGYEEGCKFSCEDRGGLPQLTPAGGKAAALQKALAAKAAASKSTSTTK